MKYAGVDAATAARDRAAGDRARRRARPTAKARSTRCRPTRRCWSCASCSRAAGRRRSTGDDGLRARGLARRRVRRLRGRPGPVAASWRPPPAGRCSTSAPAPDASRWRSRAAGNDVTALDRDAELLAELERRADDGRAGDRDRGRRRRRLRAAAPVRADRRPDADAAAAAGCGRPRGVLRRRRPRPRPRRARRRGDRATRSSRSTRARRCRCPTSASPAACDSSPSPSRCASARARCGSSGSARSSPPTESGPARDDMIELRTVDAELLAAEAGRHGLRAEPPLRHPADRRARRLHGGAVPWLTACCASARCIPT